MFGLILKQDKRILEQTRANQARFKTYGPRTPLLDSPLDLLGASIRRLLAGETLDTSVDREIRCRL